MDDPGEDIAGLLLATGRGDRAAFRQLYRATSAKLFGIALRICRDRSLAEDALQEAYSEIWQKAAAFDPARGRAQAWLAVIGRNRAIDSLRRRGRHPRPVGGDDMDAILALPDLSQRADGGVEAMALAQCLGLLEARQREALLLAYCEGRTREELAERYKAPVNTVKTWLRRGLAALRGCLEQ